jgi:hypothetical protein
MSIDFATPPPYMPIALTAKSVSGLTTASDSQSPSWPVSWWLRRRA